MPVDELRRAVEASPRAELPAVSALLWKAFAAGQVSEAEASALSEAIELRRSLPAAQKPVQQRFGSRPHLLQWRDAVAGPPPGPYRPPSQVGSHWPSKRFLP